VTCRRRRILYRDVDFRQSIAPMVPDVRCHRVVPSWTPWTF